MTGTGSMAAMAKALLLAWLGLGMAWSSLLAPPDFKPPSLHMESLPAPTGPTPDPDPVVYLTFDDGPHPVNTPQVLDLLAQYDVKATFFVVGRMVYNFPDLARRIAAEGHSVQLHSWRHDNLTKFSRPQFMADTAKTQAVLGETLHIRATCLRPPYGEVDSRVREWASDLNLDVSLWDVSGADWTEISAEGIARRVLTWVRPGSVVLLHDGGGPRHRTVSALEMILAELTEAGYRFETMCSTLYLPEPSPPCWEYYAWPVPCARSEPSQAEAR